MFRTSYFVLCTVYSPITPSATRMSATVLCSSCGNPLKIPREYKRRKLQCAACGVMCELPPPGSLEDPAESFPEPPPATPLVLEDLPVATELPPKPAAPAKLRPGKKGRRLIVTCRFCGEQVRIAVGSNGEPGPCPNCGSAVRLPPPVPKAAPPRPVQPPVVRETDADVVFTPADDGNPYPLIGGRDVVCPQCRRRLPAETVVCTLCGLNLRTGETPPPKTYEPVDMTWEVGMPLPKRRLIFLLAQAAVVPFAVLGLFLHGSWFVVFFPWILFLGLTAFLLGTYDRIELTRNTRGQCKLIKVWRVCFFERPPVNLRVTEYEGIATGVDSESGCWEWFIFFTLLGFAVVPAVIWFYMSIHRDTFFVALARDHGFPELMVYRGGSEEQMREIASTLHEVTGLPTDN